MSRRYFGSFIKPGFDPLINDAGIYSLIQNLQAKGQDKWPPGIEIDPYFKNVTLLLHGDGTNTTQNNTFIDSSTNNFTITRTGNTTQGSFSPYGNSWSNYFDGTTDYLSLADNAALEMGYDDFTIECWFYMDVLDTATLSNLIIKGTGGSTLGYGIHINTSGTVAGRVTTDGATAIAATSSSTVSIGTWYHVAFTRSGTTLTLWLNGVSVDTNTVTGALYDGATTVSIGANASGTNTFQGYISNLRIVKGTCLYTSEFTPSASPLISVPGTSLLTCQSNRFVDNSPYSFNITRNGDANVTNFSPFNPTETYSTAINGGSAYFDGTGDYLTTPSITLGTSDFTFETWVYRPSINGTSESIFVGTTNGGFSVGFESSGTVLQVSRANIAYITQTSVTIPLQQWFHLAVTKSSNVYRFFINGTQVGSDVTDATSITASAYNISANTANGTLLRGFLSNIRLVIGSVLYTSNFTPPASPLTAVTNTSLLLNFTNAAIFDNSTKNVLETVGNAQVSTTQKKFGTAAMYFDGTGDWLVIPSSQYLTFGTSDFTIEFWLYLTAQGTYNIIDQRSTASQVVPAIYTSTGQIRYYVNGVDVITGSTLNATTWYHIALSRSGTSTKLFIDGTQSGSTYTDSNNYISNPLAIGVYLPLTTNALNGYIDDLRITKGIARYTANFTAPTVSFGDR